MLPQFKLFKSLLTFILRLVECTVYSVDCVDAELMYCVSVIKLNQLSNLFNISLNILSTQSWLSSFINNPSILLYSTQSLPYGFCYNAEWTADIAGVYLISLNCLVCDDACKRLCVSVRETEITCSLVIDGVRVCVSRGDGLIDTKVIIHNNWAHSSD